MAWSTWALYHGLITPTHLTASSSETSNKLRTKARQQGKEDVSAGAGKQAVVPALMQMLTMLPKLCGAAAEGISGSALAGCERDCAKLAAKALVLIQQVTS